jgi:hypothetical protein
MIWYRTRGCKRATRTRQRSTIDITVHPLELPHTRATTYQYEYVTIRYITMTYATRPLLHPYDI